MIVLVGEFGWLLGEGGVVGEGIELGGVGGNWFGVIIVLIVDEFFFFWGRKVFDFFGG